MDYNYYQEGSVYFRDGIRNGAYVIDTTITAAGWGGAQDTDWVNVYTLTYSV